MGHVFKKRNSWITLWVLTFSLPVTNQNYPWEEILPSLCPVYFPSIRCRSGWSFPATPFLPSQHKAQDAALVPGMWVLCQLPRFGKQAYPPWCLCSAKITWSPQISNTPTELTNPHYRSTWALSKPNRIYAYTGCLNSSFHFTDGKERQKECRIQCLTQDHAASQNLMPVCEHPSITGYFTYCWLGFVCITLLLTCAATW